MFYNWDALIFCATIGIYLNQKHKLKRMQIYSYPVQTIVVERDGHTLVPSLVTSPTLGPAQHNQNEKMKRNSHYQQVGQLTIDLQIIVEIEAHDAEVRNEGYYYQQQLLEYYPHQLYSFGGFHHNVLGQINLRKNMSCDWKPLIIHTMTKLRIELEL